MDRARRGNIVKHNMFSIGVNFYTATGKWRCTDVGCRTIVAIKIDEHPDDMSWLSGPPYIVAEKVFNEHDFDGCSFVNIVGENND